jgi:hypothetical protein
MGLKYVPIVVITVSPDVNLACFAQNWGCVLGLFGGPFSGYRFEGGFEAVFVLMEGGSGSRKRV